MISRYLPIGRFFLWMLWLVPVSFAVALSSQNQTMIFLLSIAAIIPLSRAIGFAAEQIALQTNPTIGGLMSATFGNAIELIIAVFALKAGLIEVVKASIVGSIIGNILMLIGLSVFFGGLKYKEQQFNKDAAGVSSTMLIIAVIGLSIPTIYSITVKNFPMHVQLLSNAVAVVLAGIYVAGLIFSLYTHKHLFDAADGLQASHIPIRVTKPQAGVVLAVATFFAALEAEFVVHCVESAGRDLGLSQTFIGVVVIAMISNIAENSNAIQFAVQNNLDLSIEIGTSSATQNALFVVPILMLISGIFGLGFTLIFSLFEIIAVLFAVMIVNYLSSDGRCNWLEGAQLITVYLILSIAFYFI